MIGVLKLDLLEFWVFLAVSILEPQGLGASSARDFVLALSRSVIRVDTDVLSAKIASPDGRCARAADT